MGSFNPGGGHMTREPAVDSNPRREELVRRLDNGEFDDAFEVSMRSDALQAGFRLAAYTARADHDPGDDFEEFVESLWRQVANMFELQAPSPRGDAPASQQRWGDP